ncbi:LuxR C-terminal-related transcriptional regulator [Streptomyces sp. NPDC085932]|uniref:helix-turn-helix transcriptional regulator n=1 Tax=Streptomyces sp. NPDC085932 TaxID=3365741 RepID=UPI0037D9629B
MATLDDLSVVRLSDCCADPASTASLTTVGLMALRRMSTAPRCAGSFLVCVDQPADQEGAVGQVFLAAGGWLGDDHPYVAAVAQTPSQWTDDVFGHEGTIDSPTHAAQLHAVAQALLSEWVPQRLIENVSCDPALIASMVHKIRSRAWSLPDQLTAQFTPPPYREQVAARLEALSPLTRLLTQAVAVHGQEVPAAALGELLEAGQSVADLLAPAIETKLVRWTCAGTGFYRVEEIIRGAVLQSLDAARRRRLHRWAAHCTSGLASLLHGAAAMDRLDEVAALDLEVSARRSLRARELTLATQLFRMAADLSPSAGGREQRVLSAAYTALSLPHPPDAYVLRAAVDGGNGPLAAILRTRMAFTEGKPNGDTEHLLSALKGVQTDGPALDHDTRATCIRWLAEAAWLMDDLAALDQADAVIQNCREPEHHCVYTKHLVTVMRETCRHGVQAGLAALSFLPKDPVDVPPALSACLHLRGWLRLENCQPEAAVADTLEALRLATQPGAQHFAQEATLAVLAQAYLLCGAWEDAEACAALAHKIARPVWRDLCHSVHQLVLSSRGLTRRSQVTRPHRMAAYAASPLTRVIAAHADITFALGNERRRRHMTGDPKDAAAAEAYAISRRLPWRLLHLLRARCWAGSQSGARRLLSALRGSPSPATGWANVLYLWGQALVAQFDGDESEAEAFFKLAESAAEQHGESNHWHQALLHWDHARLAAQSDNWSDALTLLRAAQQKFERVEAWQMVESCNAELVRAQLKGATQGAAHRLGGNLTKREVEVASLVARGLTSKEVARKLFLSCSGVTYHLGNIYTKLGLQNRYELRAIWDTAMHDDGQKS